MPALIKIPHAPPYKILIAGGSYAGLNAALNLLDLCSGKPHRPSHIELPAIPSPSPKIPVQITIVDERDSYYHLIGSPLALSDIKYAAKSWTRFADIPALQHPSIRILQGSIKKLDCEAKLAQIELLNGDTQKEEEYDCFVAATGLRRQWPVVGQSLSREKFIKEANAHILSAERATSHGVVLVGGGAVGIEMAAELKLTHPSLCIKLIHSRSELLSSESLPEDFKTRSLELLREMGVQVLLDHRVKQTEEFPDPEDSSHRISRIEFQNGSSTLADLVLWAVSHSVPSTSYLPPEALDPEGLVLINPALNLPIATPNASSHYAIGDLVAWSGIKRCGSAMSMGHLCAVNIHQQLLSLQDLLPDESPSHTNGLSTSTSTFTSETNGKTPFDPEVEVKPEVIEIKAKKKSKRNSLSNVPAALFPEVPPMMALAVGEKAVTYDPISGMNSGVEQMKMFFNDDLGFDICWNHMQLGTPREVDVEP